MQVLQILEQGLHIPSVFSNSDDKHGVVFSTHCIILGFEILGIRTENSSQDSQEWELTQLTHLK
jgi:hypothetical protein